MSRTRLWHVTVTTGGRPTEPAEVRGALTRLADQHGFLHSMRYSGSCAEITYWDEGCELADVSALAMRVWDEHRVSADLPPWLVMGLEVLEQDVHAERSDQRRTTGGPRLGSRTPRPMPF